jgi:excisionase family DNA binding protein
VGAIFIAPTFVIKDLPLITHRLSAPSFNGFAVGSDASTRMHQKYVALKYLGGADQMGVALLLDDQELELRIERKIRRLGLIALDSWMTPTEAALHIRMSKSTFLRLCRQGYGPAHTGDGKLMRFRRSVVDRWLEGPGSKRR